MIESKVPPSEEGCDHTSLPDDAVCNIQGGVRKAIGAIQNPAMHKEQALAELARRRESGEIDRRDYFWEQLFQFDGVALRRKDLGNQALVLGREELEQLGALEIVLKSGQTILIGSESLDPDDVLIIYPDELGDEESGAPDESGDGESGAE